MKAFVTIICMLFASLNVRAQSDSARIDSIIHTLPDVMVKGERPIVRVNGAALVYDLQRLIGSKQVDNAYDALKELPGVSEQNGSITLSGLPVSIVIDGKVTTLTAEQLAALLRSIPTSRIANAEVMYNAPARYQLRGAVININLHHEKGETPRLQGETNLAWNQEHHARFAERLSLTYASKRLSMDFMYRYNHGSEYYITEETAQHSQTGGNVYNIRSHETALHRKRGHDYRLGIDCNIGDKHSVSFVYTGNYETNHARQNVNGDITSDFNIDFTHRLHNLRMDYKTPFGLNAGTEYTYYKTPETQLLHSTMPTGSLDYRVENAQKISRWKAFVAQEHQLHGGWNINYGAIYTASSDHSTQYYTNTAATPGTTPADETVKQREDNVNIYVGTSKQFSQKLSAEVSLAAEYYHSSAWHQWNLYPTFNLSYKPTEGHLLQLSMSSDKKFPPYWTISNFITYGHGGYNEVTGNPLLKPSDDYQLQLVYVLKSKYQLVTWYNYHKDYFVQTPYQRQDRLAVQYRYLNFDFNRQAGAQLSAPFALGSWYNTRVNLIGVWMQQKASDFYDIPFNRHIAFCMAQMNNTFTIAKQPDLTLTLDGMIRTKAIQATYDLPASGNVDASLVYKFARKRAIVKLFCNDLFETSSIDPRIDYAHQHMQMDFSCYRTFGISLTYRFGGYREKRREEVDTSRFKQ